MKITLDKRFSVCVCAAYRRSNSESQDYAPNTRQSLQRQPPPNQYPPMPVYMSSPGPQRVGTIN